MIGHELRCHVERDGFVIVPEVFDSVELNELRIETLEALTRWGIQKGGGTVLPNAALRGGAALRILTNSTLVTAAREILGARPVATLEADLHRNFQASSWHKDTGEMVMQGGYFGLDPIGRDDCRVVKVAVYLQDHRDGGGLNVKPGSHRQREIAEGLGTELSTNAGDAVIFDVRITHRGPAPSFVDRVLGKVLLARSGPFGQRYLSAARVAKNRFLGRADRLAVYVAYGAPGPLTDSFANRNMERQLRQLAERDFRVSATMRSDLEAAGVGTANFVSERKPLVP